MMSRNWKNKRRKEKKEKKQSNALRKGPMCIRRNGAVQLSEMGKESLMTKRRGSQADGTLPRQNRPRRSEPVDTPNMRFPIAHIFNSKFFHGG